LRLKHLDHDDQRKQLAFDTKVIEANIEEVRLAERGGSHKEDHDRRRMPER